MRQLFYFLVIMLLLNSCNYFKFESTSSNVMIDGLKPIYAVDDSWKEIIFSDSPPPLKNLGKLYYKDDILYATQKDEGVFIIDNTDPSNPRPLHYVMVKGATDIAIKGNSLYVDNLADLVTINIADFDNMFVEKRVENLYPIEEQLFPEGYTGYFECVDADKGVVVGWEEALLTDPKCNR